jgi:hypothetical protein
LLFLLLALLSAGRFGYIEQEGDGKEDAVIRTPQPSGTIIGSLRMLQIIYALDATHISRIPFFMKIISVDYIPGTPFDPFSADPLSCSSRSPPRLINIL